MFLLYFLVAYFATNALMTVAYVGKPREAVTPSVAMWSVAIYAGLITLVITLWPAS